MALLGQIEAARLATRTHMLAQAADEGGVANENSLKPIVKPSKEEMDKIFGPPAHSAAAENANVNSAVLSTETAAAGGT